MLAYIPAPWIRHGYGGFLSHGVAPVLIHLWMGFSRKPSDGRGRGGHQLSRRQRVALRWSWMVCFQTASNMCHSYFDKVKEYDHYNHDIHIYIYIYIYLWLITFDSYICFPKKHQQQVYYQWIGVSFFFFYRYPPYRKLYLFWGVVEHCTNVKNMI